MTINYVDLAVILIFVLCVVRSGRRGLTYFVVSAVGKIISLVASLTMYGAVSSFLRETPFFLFLKEQIAPFVSVDALFDYAGVSEHLMANDNSEIYKLFRVETFEDYVSSYFANILLNIVSVLLVYICVSLIISALFKANRIASGVPIIRGLNGVTGVLAGVFEAIIIIWILVIILIFFTLQGKLLGVYDMLLASNIGIYFFEYNIIKDVIFNVTA